MIALAALCGVLIAGGLWTMFAGFNSHTPTVPKLSTQLWTIPVDGLRRRTAIILAASLLVGGLAAAFTGWWLLVLIAPAVALVLPMLLSAPQNRELELLQAIDRWVRMLGSLLTTGRSIVDAVRISSRQAPVLLSPSLHRLTARLDERWTIEQALLAMADELDSPDADAVLAALALAAQRGGTGASVTLTALADIRRVDCNRCAKSAPSARSRDSPHVNEQPRNTATRGGGHARCASRNRTALSGVRLSASSLWNVEPPALMVGCTRSHRLPGGIRGAPGHHKSAIGRDPATRALTHDADPKTCHHPELMRMPRQLRYESGHSRQDSIGDTRRALVPTRMSYRIGGNVSENGFYRGIKRRRSYSPNVVGGWFSEVSQERVNAIGVAMEEYISANLPKVIRSKSKLGDYRTSPYVLMATAGALRLEDLRDLSKFLVDIKLYMGLETSFGKSIETVIMQHYPAGATASNRWAAPIEKIEEFSTYVGLSNEAKSAKRVDSVWREIDSACVHGTRRHLLTIKSGTATINDTQVSGMFNAIRDNHGKWLASSKERFGVDGIDVVIGLTYGTDWATNNKENQILAKLLSAGFTETDRASQPGVVQNADGSVRVYRAIGIDYWGYTADPTSPSTAEFAFLEVLLGLARALRLAHEKSDIGAALNERLDLLGDAFKSLRFPEGDHLPAWVGQELGVTELTWLAAAMSAFFD